MEETYAYRAEKIQISTRQRFDFLSFYSTNITKGTVNAVPFAYVAGTLTDENLARVRGTRAGRMFSFACV